MKYFTTSAVEIFAHSLTLNFFIKKSKINIHPLIGHEGPQSEMSYKSTLSLTSALVRGACSTPPPFSFNPLDKKPVPILQEPV